ncbi:MAG: phage major capsid protein [Vicinamibacterales bacterium]
MNPFLKTLDQSPGGVTWMPGSDTTQWDPLFKDDYAPAIVTQLSEDNLMTSWMETEVKDDSWTGRQKVVPIMIGRNRSVGSIPSRGRLPQAGRSVFEDFNVPMRNTYGRVGFEREVIAQSRNRKGSWQQVIPAEMDALVEAVSFHRNRVMWGYGSGILALVNGTHTAQTTIVIDSPGNVSGSLGGARYLDGDVTSGQYVAFLDSGNNIVATATITGVATNLQSITVDTAITVPDNAKIVIAQSAAQSSYNMEPEGVLAGIDDGTYVDTYHGLSRTTYPILNAYVTTGVGGLSLDAIQQMCDAVHIKTGKMFDMFACEHAVRRAYLVLLESDRRYSGADLMRPDGGTAAAKKPGGRTITYGDIPVMVDRDAPYQMLFGINKMSWTRYVENEGQWADEEGHVLKWVNEYDEYTAFYFMQDNFHCQRPNVNARAEGIDVDQLVLKAA